MGSSYLYFVTAFSSVLFRVIVILEVSRIRTGRCCAPDRANRTRNIVNGYFFEKNCLAWFAHKKIYATFLYRTVIFLSRLLGQFPRLICHKMLSYEIFQNLTRVKDIVIVKRVWLNNAARHTYSMDYCSMISIERIDLTCLSKMHQTDFPKPAS